MPAGADRVVARLAARVPGRRPRPTGCGPTSAAPTSCGTPTAPSTCWRTTCGCPPASPTCWRTGRSPSGSSPSCSSASRSARSTATPSACSTCCARCAPAATGRAVVLTPGIYNSAYFEHSFLARQMGVELVEDHDLLRRQDDVVLRAHHRGPGPGRRDLPPGRRLVPRPRGVPGRLRARRARPDAGLAGRQRGPRQRPRHRRGRRQGRLHLRARPDPLLPGRGADPAQRAHLPLRGPAAAVPRARQPRRAWWSSRPTSRAARASSSAPRPTGRTLDRYRERLRADPRGWVAQPVVELSCSPRSATSALEPRCVDLRPFTLQGAGSYVTAGGLTRVARRRGSYVVNSSQGGGSKDTWIVEDGAPRRPAPRADPASAAEATAPEAGAPVSEPDPAVPDGRFAVLGRPLPRAGRRPGPARPRAHRAARRPAHLGAAHLGAAAGHPRATTASPSATDRPTRRRSCSSCWPTPETPSSLRWIVARARENLRTVRQVIPRDGVAARQRAGHVRGGPGGQRLAARPAPGAARPGAGRLPADRRRRGRRHAPRPRLRVLLPRHPARAGRHDHPGARRAGRRPARPPRRRPQRGGDPGTAQLYEDLQWLGVLRSVLAQHSFRRSTSQQAAGDTVVPFLLFDDRHPRSVAFCLDQVAAALGRLPRSERPAEACLDARLLLGRPWLPPARGRRAAIHDVADELQLAIGRIDAALRSVYFEPGSSLAGAAGLIPSGRADPAASAVPDSCGRALHTPRCAGACRPPVPPSSPSRHGGAVPRRRRPPGRARRGRAAPSRRPRPSPSGPRAWARAAGAARSTRCPCRSTPTPGRP